MDSCVTAAEARERHGASNIAVLHASYGQRTEARERRAFTEIADHYAVPSGRRLIVQLDYFRAIGGSALTDATIAVPEISSTSRHPPNPKAQPQARSPSPTSPSATPTSYP